MQTKEEKQKAINEAVNHFKKMLETTFKNKPFFRINMMTLDQALTGSITKTLMKNGNLKISGELPKFFLKDTSKGLPRTYDDYAIFPLLVGLFQQPEEEIFDKQKQKSL